MSDPNYYRKYECNLETYNIKARTKLRCTSCELGAASADSMNCSTLLFSKGGISTYSGTSNLATSHAFTSTNLPPLGNRDCNGELTFYLNNDVYVSVSMGIVVKSNNTILQTLVYQRVGNFTTIDLSFSGNTVTLTASPAAVVRWVYRGI
jgi:hypothetical protein